MILIMYKSVNYVQPVTTVFGPPLVPPQPVTTVFGPPLVPTQPITTVSGPHLVPTQPVTTVSGPPQNFDTIQSQLREQTARRALSKIADTAPLYPV